MYVYIHIELVDICNANRRKERYTYMYVYTHIELVDICNAITDRCGVSLSRLTVWSS